MQLDLEAEDRGCLDRVLRKGVLLIGGMPQVVTVRVPSSATSIIA